MSNILPERHINLIRHTKFKKKAIKNVFQVIKNITFNKFHQPHGYLLPVKF